MKRTITAGVLALLVLPAGVTHGDELAASVAPFVGSYRYAGGAAELAALDAAIDEVVGKMNALVRWIARRKLRAPNLPSEAIVLSWRDGALTVARPGHPTVTAPADGEPIAWTSPEGDKFQLRHGVAGAALYQRFEGAQSVSVNHLRLAPGGRLLTVETRVESPRLPAPLVFRFTYERGR